VALGCRGLSGLPWVEWVVNGGCGFVGCQWKRIGFVSVKRRIRKVGGRKEKKKRVGDERENNDILMK
jgi:hypothetical protein